MNEFKMLHAHTWNYKQVSVRVIHVFSCSGSSHYGTNMIHYVPDNYS